MRLFERSNLWILTVVAVMVLGTGWASAQTPQTIVIDGVNDFLPVNLAEDDAGDTEHLNIDLGEVYVTNDAVNLYFGAAQDPDGWTTVQIGIAIDVNTPDGGLTDPWGRQIEWSLVDNKPDFIFYVNLDNNWQGGLAWDGADWTDIGSGPGTGALGWDISTGFKELGVMLATLGVGAGDVINYAMWITQDGVNKGPLDALSSDEVQLSVPGTTVWETATPIPMFDMLPYTVAASDDFDPPLVNAVEPAFFPADSFFDVYFNEPVDAVTAGVAGNYDFPGFPGLVLTATPDGSDASVVHLELNTALLPSGSLYTLEVTGVEDMAGNPIVDDGVGNVNCFMLKHLLFRGLFGPFLSTQVAPLGGFSIEGSQAPLTWSPLCDTGIMTDVGGDIYEWETVVSVPGDCVAGTASSTFDYKFVYDCVTYEPLASNRLHTMDLAGGASDTLEFWWNDEDPSAFTAHDIDVEFFVDMSNHLDYVIGDTISINGNILPLSHVVPSLNDLVDDGTGNDDLAGDGVFSGVITFPAGSKKDVTYKFLRNGTYECDGQGDRDLFLNDELFDTVGGALGPLTLPVVHFDFCNAIWRAVEVVFSVDFNNTAYYTIGAGDVVGVNGTENNAEPPTFDWSVPSVNTLADDGVAPDLVAGDKIYTVSVVFPDTSAQQIDYKFLLNDEYECLTQGNRSFSIDPDNYDALGNPQVLTVDVFQICNLSPVPQVERSLILGQNLPNPFNPSTEIRFTVPEAGRGTLRVYNVRGELVRTLLSGDFAAGPGSVVWNGRTDSGLNAGSGVYFYRLDVGVESVTKRMLLL